MSNKQNEDNKPEVIGLTKQDLATLITEVRKPYEDPAVIAQQEMMREQKREDIRRQLAEKQEKVLRCSHMRHDNSYNLHSQKHENGHITIMCGYCGGVWKQTDPKWQDMIRHVNLQFMSEARQS